MVRLFELSGEMRPVLVAQLILDFLGPSAGEGELLRLALAQRVQPLARRQAEALARLAFQGSQLHSTESGQRERLVISRHGQPAEAGQERR